MTDTITMDRALAFLAECAGYFERRPTNGEDAAHWSNVSNAETCRRIAELFTASPPPAASPASPRVDAVSRLDAVGVQPEQSETFHYQADGYASGWHAAIAAYRQGIRRLPSLASDATPAPTSGSEDGGEDWEQLHRERGKREVEIMQEYAWGNLTKLGVANHLYRAGFLMTVAREKAEALAKPASEPAGEDPRWQQLRDMLGLDGWHDGHFNGLPNPDQIISHVQHIANERARLLTASGPAGGDVDALRKAAEEFCRRVEAGEIRSKRSYAAFKAALSSSAGPAVEPVDWPLPEDRDLPPVTERGLAGQIMDAAWPHYGGNNQPAEFWNDFGEGVRFALHYAHPAPATVEMREALKPFADIANDYADQEDDDFQVWKDFDVLGASLPLRIFRRARTAYQQPAALAPATEGTTDAGPRS